ncbi:hypothetical protein cgR_2582 [Corynebacterium glutamicum R]|uniref:Uncharacterized protein n=1 Tax=Corynebacterium glutamicum (strain R) TaxID=340322 RepID=A0AB72VDY0_CORGB|nr:hypothetical protein cgR_2582 [Corynebacterium glutamicum R]
MQDPELPVDKVGASTFKTQRLKRWGNCTVDCDIEDGVAEADIFSLESISGVVEFLP